MRLTELLQIRHANARATVMSRRVDEHAVDVCHVICIVALATLPRVFHSTMRAMCVHNQLHVEC
jgi:hypothetical protein